MRNRFLFSVLAAGSISFSAFAQPSVQPKMAAMIGGYFKDTTGVEIATNALLYPLDIIENNTFYITGGFNEKNEFIHEGETTLAFIDVKRNRPCMPPLDFQNRIKSFFE